MFNRNHVVERLQESNDQYGEGFSQIPNLNLYQKTLTGVKQYEYSPYKKAFMHRSLKNLSTACTGHKPYQCQECGKLFCKGQPFRKRWLHTDDRGKIELVKVFDKKQYMSDEDIKNLERQLKVNLKVA